MKRVILLSILLTGCADDIVIQVHLQAKLAPKGYSSCYTVTEPTEIQGRYCLTYKGTHE